MFVRLLVITCLSLTATVTSSVGSTAHAAPLPSGWCGPGESAADLPDVAAGAQIHAVYAYAADVPDRSDLWLPRIARDLAGIDSWWQDQDPTRAPRFDMADFPGCPTQFGQLDISTVALNEPTAAYNTAQVAALSSQVRTEIWGSTGLAPTFGKVYLVYLDLPVAFERVCGSAFPGNLHPGNGPVRAAFVYIQPFATGCATSGGYGSGAGWPARTAAHELLHLFAGQIRSAPRSCPDDASHICGPEEDVLKGEGGRGGLDQAILDPGRDDYYGHGIAGQWDVRNSPWLAHLDTQPVPVNIAISPAGAGQVVSTAPGINCPAACSAAFDPGAEIELTAVPAPGYGVSGWIGECRLVDIVRCTATPAGPTTLTARFVPVSPVRIQVTGNGSISSDGGVCSTRCLTDAVRGSTVKYLAEAASGSSFTGWTGACRGARKRCVVKVKRPVHVGAKFVEKKKPRG